jgi:hypothetical protein
MKKNRAKFSRRKLVYITVGLILCIVVLISISSFNVLYRPFEDFSGPRYLPQDFNQTNNMSDDNKRIFEYSGNGTFYVGVIKNTSDEELHDLLNPFEEDPSDVIMTNSTVVVDGQDVVFQLSEKHVEIQKAKLKNLFEKIPTNQTNKDISDNIQDIEVNLVKFHAQWYSNDTKLTYVVTGLTSKEEILEINKMTASITSRPPKSAWPSLPPITWPIFSTPYYSCLMSW